MAKKDKFELDDFGFEKELDFGSDIDFEIEPPKDDRKPITKAAVGFATGAKDAAFSNQFVKRFIKKALPKGYGDAMEMAGEGVGEASKLYNSTVKELKPTIKEMKRVTGRALSQVEGKIPKKLADKLKAWSDSGKEDSSGGQTDFRESSIAMQLGEVFEEQIKEANKQQQQNEVQNAVRDNMAQKRHTDIFEQLEGIRMSASRLSTYQDKVTVNFQRKSLELQYRQYYIMSDMLEEHKKANEQFKTNLSEIVKNTGLPEYAKIQNSERLGEMMRNKFMGNIYETIFDKRRGYLGKAVNRLGTRIKDKVTDFAGDVQNGLAGADMMMDAGESAREMGMPGIDKYDIAGNIAGGIAANSAGEKLGTKAGQWLNKSRFGKKIRTLGSNLEYATSNVSQIGDKFSRGDYDYDEGMAGKIIQTMSKLPGGEMALEALKDAAFSGRPDQSFKVDGIKDMQGPAVFSNQTRKSINEVIPGFLARIYQELQIIRTGDDKVGLTEYDFGSNKFTGAKALMSSIMSKVVNKGQTDRFKDENDELINQIDPEGKLNKKERGELGKFFLSDNFKNGLADPKRFTDSSEFRGVSRDTAMKAAQLFQQSFGIDDFGGIDDKENFAIKRNKFSNNYGGLGMGFNDSREMIQNLLNLGHHDVIRQTGLMNDKGEFDPDKLHGYMSGDEAPEMSGRSPLAGMDKSKRMKSRRKDQQVQQTIVQNHYVPPAETDNGVALESLDTLKQILAMIEKSNNKAFIENIANTSMRIEAIMMEGIFRNGETERSTMGEGEKRRWYQASIGDILGGTVGSVSKGVKYIGRQLDKAAKNTVKLGTTVVGKAASLGMKGLNWATKKRDELCDIYLSGEATPRIQAWRLKAGHYIDQKTGEVIKKISDIKGTVIDKDGNVILSFEDMKNIIPPDGRSKLKQAFDGIIGLGKKGIATITGSYDAAWQLAKQAGKMGKGLVMRVLAKDVYVVGEEQPRLLAITMRVGGYRSKITGKTIWKPIQIDGPVLNSEGEMVITDADLRKGIVDASGNPFKSMLSKVIGLGKSVIGGTIKNVKKAAKWTSGKAVDAVDIATQFIKNAMGVESGGAVGGGFNLGLGGKSNSKVMVDRLSEIRDILKDRLPERKKKLLGDSDGDGDRENSWQDNAQKRTDAQKAQAGDGKSGIGKGKTVGGLTAAAIAAKKKEEDEKKEDEDGMGLTDAAAAVDLAKTGWGGLKKGGSKVLGWGKKLAGKVGLKGLGLAGAAYGGYSAYDNVKKGNYGEAAVDAGIAAGGAAMTYGAGAATTAAAGTAAASGVGIMGAIGGGLATVGGAALGLLSSPVVLGALAVAAVGAAGYYGYKALTKEKLKPLSTYRFAQYGFMSKDEDALQKVFSLENRLMDSVIYEAGVAKLKEGKITMKDILGVLSIDESNKKMIFRFEQWFQGRFKPVFLTHMTALNAIAPSCKLSDVDSKLKPEEKKKYFEASVFKDGPYSLNASPIETMPGLIMGAARVNTVAKETLEAINKELGDKKSETGIEEGKGGAVAAATAATALVPKSFADGTEMPKAANEGEYGLDLKTKSRDGVVTNAVNAVKRTTGIGSETGIGLVMTAEVVNDEKQISPLNAIRYRTYGLYNLEIPKINNLLTLEQTTLEMMKFSGESVEWAGDIDRVIDRCGDKFGVSNYNSRQGMYFSMWFNARFLPVFKNYVNTIYLATGKKNIREAVKLLTPTQILAVANAVYTSRGDYNGKSNIPVWKVTQSPWADYVINTNEATVHESVKALTAKAKDDVAQEKVPVKKADALTEPTLDKDKAQAEKNASLWDKTKDMFGKAGSWMSDKAGKAWDATKNAAGSAWDATKKVGSGISDVASAAATKAKEYGSQAMGAMTTTVNNVAAGIGGMIDQIPMPTKGGSYDALKDTITAASKMVGVDEKLMAIMAAIESGFNYSVKAGTSSATGLYQFIDSTWKYMVKNYGAKYGIAAGTSPQDPRANAVLGAEFLKMNMGRLAPTLGRAPTYTDMYLAHFMGDGGAKKFLKAMQQDPNAVAPNIFPKEAAANPTIFYTDKTKQQPRTLQDIYNHFTDMISKKAKSFKIDTGLAKQQAANDPKATGPVSPPPDVGTGVAPGTDPKAGGGVANATAQATGGSAPVGGATPASPTGTSKTAEMIAADNKTPKTAAPAAPVSGAPVQAGFSQTPPQQIAQQQQATKEEFSKSIGTIDRSLIELVEIQRSAKGTLEGILQALQSTGAAKLPNAADSTGKGPAVRTGMKEEMKSPPVPMRKSA